MKYMSRRFVLALAAALSLTAVHADEPVRFESGAQQTRLLELYTSEGCSSCPPAERWYTQLRDDAGLWESFVPLAFHVTYWNYLGWRDEFSDATYDQRQRRNAARAGSGVYTPGVFLDGTEYRQWRGRRAAPGAQASSVTGKLSVEVVDGRIDVRFAPPATHQKLRVEVALLASGLTSRVRAGENKGRVLTHDFVVTDLSRASLARDGDAWTTTIDLPSTKDVARPALAVWVVDAQGAPLQATGGWLASAT